MSGGGGINDRFVRFAEVRLGPGNWTSYPGTGDFLEYSVSLEDHETSFFTITRSDGKALTINFSSGISFEMNEHLIRFDSGYGDNAGNDFQ
jgi:hypothetical protein